MSLPADLDKLRRLVNRLRAPDGCPWDREQGLADMRAYMLEEAHELAEALDGAVEKEDYTSLAEELGDLLFQIVFIACLADEAGKFDLGDVIDRIHDKMIARHPHVFGEERLADTAAVNRAWEQRKVNRNQDRSLLAGVPAALPALVGSYRLTQKVAGVGFDWPAPSQALAKVHEELEEVEEALAAVEATDTEENQSALREELGDLLFTVANVARKVDVDPEAALAATNRKFRRRFEGVEQRVKASDRKLGDVALTELDRYWDEVKATERGEG